MSSAVDNPGKKPVPEPTAGCSFPIGATLVPGGVNFSVFSRSAARVELLLFDRVDDARPSRVISMDPSTNRTYHYWHVLVPRVQVGQIYGFRAFGLYEPDQGLRFDHSKLLLDPYGRAVTVPKDYSREAASLAGDNTATAMKSVVTDPQAYDWGEECCRTSDRSGMYSARAALSPACAFLSACRADRSSPN
ncbi:MAG: hypothetical protein ACLPH3_11485 [Terracidiphilus sp.]